MSDRAKITIHCVPKSFGDSYDICVSPTATIHEVRTFLAPLIKRKLAGILLFDGDDYLQNNIRLDQYEIGDGATLNYEARMCGILPADHDWSKSGLKTKPTRFAF
jgi:hypothetical protein